MTSKDTRRSGDERGAENDEEVSLTLRPAHGQPFRWLPRHGAPLCIAEWLSQHLIRGAAWWPIYTAIVTTLTLLAVVFGVPFLEEG